MADGGVTRLRAGREGQAFRSNFVFFGYRGGCLLGDRADHSPPSVSEVKNTWVVSPPFPHASFWRDS
jgi:hypothetical protein